MTPVASWTPADYHRAVNRARAAWEATQPQLVLDGWADGLDEPQEAGTATPANGTGKGARPVLSGVVLRFVEPGRLDGLDRAPNECRRRPVEPATSISSPDGAGSQTAGEPHRTPPSGRSTRGQDASSPAYTNTTAPAAEPEWDLRGRGQKGA